MSLESAFAVTRMIGMKGRLRVALQPAAYVDTVELRHHHIEQYQVGQKFLRCRKRLLAVGGMVQVVAVGRQPHRENVAIGRVVVDDQDARRIVHGPAAERNTLSTRSR